MIDVITHKQNEQQAAFFESSIFIIAMDLVQLTLCLWQSNIVVNCILLRIHRKHMRSFIKRLRGGRCCTCSWSRRSTCLHSCTCRSHSSRSLRCCWHYMLCICSLARTCSCHRSCTVQNTLRRSFLSTLRACSCRQKQTVVSGTGRPLGILGKTQRPLEYLDGRTESDLRGVACRQPSSAGLLYAVKVYA